MMLLSGCGGGGGSPQEAVHTPTELNNIFAVALCSAEDQNDASCADAKAAFDLDKHNVAVLSAPEDIGASLFTYFDGKRYMVVPKEEKEVTALHMLAQGLVDYAKEMREGGNPLPEGMDAILDKLKDYQSALAFLKEHGLTGTKEQNEALLNAFNYNLELFGMQGIPLKRAYDADIKAMAEELVNLTVKEPDFQLDDLKPCDSDYPGGPCIQKGIALEGSMEEIFRLSRKVVFKAGKALKEAVAKSASDPIYEALTCEDNEEKQIYMYGLDDAFNTNNPEPAHLSTALANMLAGNSQYLAGYDTPAAYPNLKIFADTHSGLPSNLTKGTYAIGLKEAGVSIKDHDPEFTDHFYIGDMAAGNFQQGYVYTLRSTWGSLTPDVYYKELSNIVTGNGQSLLAMLQSGQSSLDTVIMMTTNVDFVAITACVPKPKPQTTPVPEIPTKLECNEDKGEQMLTIMGGTADDFAQPIDPTQPSASITAILGSNAIKYDQKIEKVGNFGDTLQNPNLHITQMELLVNTRPSSSASGTANDYIYAGNKDLDHFMRKDPNDPGIATPNGGTAHLIYGNETVYDAAGNTAGTLLGLMNTNHSDLDIVVSAQTEVDVTRLKLCVVKEDVKGDISIDKHIVSQTIKGGVLYATYALEFGGSLPAGETLSISDTVPPSSAFTAINANGWNCSPAAPLSAGQTLTCTLTGPADPIPTIGIKLLSKELKEVTNCATIEKGTHTYYNTNPENDRSCVDTNVTTTQDPEALCQDTSIDLRPASTWVDSETGSQPPVHIDTWAWDSSMNWFSFDEGWEKKHYLSVDFCACGPTDIVIDEMKADNLAKIYLDTDQTPANFTNVSPNSYIVTRTINQNQATMASWATNESGILHVPFNGSTLINHTLHFDIKNGSGTAGGAVNGSIKFKGYPGQCTTGGVVDGTPDTNNTVPTPTDTNWTVVDATGVLHHIVDITYTTDPDLPAGVDGNGTIVIGIAGPAVIDYPHGKPFVDEDPFIVINEEDLNSTLSGGALVAAQHLIDPPEYTRDNTCLIVTDHGTGLQWQDNETIITMTKPWITFTTGAAGDYLNTSGDTATTYCENLSLCGHTDWRLPTKTELLNIVDYGELSPSIDTSAFENTTSDLYWTATSYEGGASNAWIVDFGYGNATTMDKQSNAHIRCVR